LKKKSKRKEREKEEKEERKEFFAKGKQAGSISFKFIAVWTFEILLISFD